MVCAQCRGEITGRYLKAGRLTFHPEHFLCKACGKPIPGQFNVHAGGFYHGPCFAADHAPRCGLCNEPMVDRHIVFEGKKYHELCYGKHLATKCVVCQRNILGVALTDHWGNTYHEAHTKEFGTCLYCGKLTHQTIGGGGLSYPDNRVICRGCHKTAVHREGDLQRTVASIRQRMATWGVDLGDIQVPVRMVDRVQLANMLTRGPHQHFKRVSGFASMKWENHGREVKNKTATIFLLSGMPLGWLEGTAAHELMHVWNFHNGPSHSFPLEEGSCNYMAYRIHTEQTKDPMASYHIEVMDKDPDPAYGAGYRRVRKYVERNGFEKLLTLLRRSKDFPLLDGFF